MFFGFQVLAALRVFLEANKCNRLDKLVETISKKPIPAHQKNVIFEITADDQSGEDVEVPYVMLKLRK